MLIEQYKELLKVLETKSKVIKNVYEQEIIIKEIPDSDIDSGYDPRVLQVSIKETEENSSFSHGNTIQEMRDNMGWPNLDVTGGSISVEKRSITGRDGGDIPVRIYQPAGHKTRPCMVFFHGGGFFGGSLECVENPCKCIALHADAAVVSADYGLAPERPFPNGFHDNFDIVTWIYEHPEAFSIDKEKIGVCGDSAGGNMAAVCTQKDRDIGTKMIKFQAMLYPVVNVGGIPNDEYTWDQIEYNIKEHVEMLEESVRSIGKNIKFLVDVYLNGNEELCTNPYVSPLFASDVTGTPATLIINAEYDYLRLEGEAYGRKLKRAGVPVTMIRYNGTDHAFMDKIGIYPQAEDAMKEVAKAFLKAIHDDY